MVGLRALACYVANARAFYLESVTAIALGLDPVLADRLTSCDGSAGSVLLAFTLTGTVHDVIREFKCI